MATEFLPSFTAFGESFFATCTEFQFFMFALPIFTEFLDNSGLVALKVSSRLTDLFAIGSIKQ